MNIDLSECSARFHIKRGSGVVWVEGQVANNREHKHHALQITWSTPDTQAMLALEDTSISGACLVIEGGVPHTLTLDHGLIALLDSASPLAERVRSRHLDKSERTVLEGFDWSGDFADAEAMLDALVGDEPAPALDARVREVLDWLDTLEDEQRWAQVSLDGALRIAHLSRGRFLHLFSQEVRSPWRTYLIWRRALVAMALVSEGKSLTDAAHASGYADSAHLSRQFSSLFGVTPGDFAKNSHFLQS